MIPQLIQDQHYLFIQYCSNSQNNINNQMLVKLRNFIKQPSFSQLSKFGLTDTHNPLNLMEMIEHFGNLSSSKRSKLVDQLILSMDSKSWIWELKIYMIFHQLLLETGSVQLQEKLLMLQFKPSTCTNKQDIKPWIRNNITKQYHIYLTKLCLDLQLINSCEKKHMQKSIETGFINQINKSFKALNLMVEIMQAQSNFNKMGRYYPEYLVIFDLFKKYLEDIKKYYERIKYTVSHVLDNYFTMSDEEITHGYYFLNEALTTSDRQYEFFYNRYFYEKMKYYTYPTFYQLDYEKHAKMIKHLKKRNLKLEFKNPQQERTKSKPKPMKDVRDIKQLRHTQSISLNKTLDGNEITAVTIQDHCQTLGDYGFSNKYEEEVESL